MGPSRIHAYKTRAIKKHKGQRLLNDFILYTLTALACTSFCSSPLWYPPFCATFNVFLVFALPKVTSFFLTSKALFIVGNLIVIFLLGESKFSGSKSKAYNDVCHDKYELKRIDEIQAISPSRERNGTKIIKNTPEQETVLVKVVESKTCDENDHEEFFELYNDEETCDSDVDQMVESSGRNHEDLSCTRHVSKIVEEEKHDALEGDEGLIMPTEKLNKLVDDFIARVNRQRMLEAEFCRG